MEKEATEKSTLRTKSIGTKVSEEEYAQLEKLAEARGRARPPGVPGDGSGDRNGGGTLFPRHVDNPVNEPAG